MCDCAERILFVECVVGTTYGSRDAYEGDTNTMRKLRVRGVMCLEARNVTIANGHHVYLCSFFNLSLLSGM